MGQLVNGVWKDEWYDTKSTGGAFKRTTAAFRNWITADGRAGPSGDAGFEPESGRYHLYVSYACPWAHRTLIFRALKGLADQYRHFGRASRYAVRRLDLCNGFFQRQPGMRCMVLRSHVTSI